MGFLTPTLCSNPEVSPNAAHLASSIASIILGPWPVAFYSMHFRPHARQGSHFAAARTRRLP